MFVKYLLVILFICGCSAVPGNKRGRISTRHEGRSSTLRVNSTSLIESLHFGKKSYYLGYTFKATYFQAAQFCRDIHMSLVSIQSQEENDQLFNYIKETNKGDNFWSSGANVLDGKHWIWMGKGESVEYTNWATNQPDNENERCLEVLRDKDKGLLWNDRDCNGMLNFICEKEDQDTDSPENDSVSSWANVFDNSYVSPNVPLLHFGAKSYFVGRYFKATFLEAIGICKMMNMHLVTITSEEENTRLYKYIRDTNAGDGFWSSGSKLIDGKMWIWMSTSQIIEYTNWAPKQPDNNNEQCIHLILRKDNGLLWNDLGCNDRLHYICEKPRDFDSLDVNAKDVFGAGYGDSIIPCKDQHDLFHYASSNIPLFQVEGKFYHLGNFKATYFQALEFCHNHQMDLVSIPTAEDDKILHKLLSKHTQELSGFWTSARKLGDTWEWSSGQPITYFNWASGEPSSEDCIEIYNDDSVTWRSQPCKHECYFICERNSRPSSSSALNPVLNIYINNETPSYNSTLFKNGGYYVFHENSGVVYPEQK